MCGTSLAVRQGWPSPVPGLGQLSKSPRVPQGLPAVHQAQPLKEPLVVRSGVSGDPISQQHGVTDVHWVNADSDLMPVLNLRPLRKRLRAHQGQPPLASGACGPLKVVQERLPHGPAPAAWPVKQPPVVGVFSQAESQGVIRVE